MDEDDPLGALLRGLGREPAPEVAPPPWEDARPGPEFDGSAEVVGDPEASAPPAQSPSRPQDEPDPAAEMRSRLEFIRKELPPAQRREWMLRLVSQFKDLTEDIALVNELNDYMRLAMEEERTEEAFWEQTSRAWERRHGPSSDDAYA